MEKYHIDVRNVLVGYKFLIFPIYAERFCLVESTEVSKLIPISYHDTVSLFDVGEAVDTRIIRSIEERVIYHSSDLKDVQDYLNNLKSLVK